MKKRILLFIMTLVLGIVSWSASAATGWFQDYIKLNVNGAGVTAPTGWYWIGSDPSYATSFVAGLGTVTSLKLDGADMKYWSDNQDRTGGAFYYQVTSSDGNTTYIAATEVIWSQNYLGGNDYQGISSDLNVDLLSGIPAGTACKLTVWAKSWGSNQGDSWLNNGGSNYVATFTVAPVSVSGSASQDGYYSTLGAAITAIGTTQSGNNIEVKIGASTTESSTVTIGNGSWASLKIYPISSGVICSAVYFNLSGAKNVTIDGRVNATGTPAVGATTSLTLSSTSSTNPVISFDNDAQTNTVKYCIIKIGDLPSSTGGIAFGTNAGTINGNGNNVIDRNLITSSGAIYPFYAVYATGNTTNPNKGNQITNNEFTNFMKVGPVSGAPSGIYISGNATAIINDNYTISGNSFYGSLSTNAGGNRYFIQIGAGNNGGTHTVTGNYIGGTSAQCGGTKMIKSGNAVSNFQGINIITSGAGTTLVQNNTIQNIQWTASSGQTSAQNFTAISVGGTGNATISGNVIGNTTTGTNEDGSTASIVSSIYNTSASSVSGISITTIGTVACEYNQIGSIYAINNDISTSARPITFNGISKSASAGTTTIRYNTIGSPTAAHSIYFKNFMTDFGQSMNGISCVGASSSFDVSYNTVANLTDFNSRSTNSTNAGYFYGITAGGSSTTGTINGNLVHSLITINFAGQGTMAGIFSNNGTNTITNNVVILGNDANPCDIRGIADQSTNAITSYFYHNTVYIKGAPASGSYASACFRSQNNNASTSKTIKNNIFVNTRSGGTGKHYALYLVNTGTLVVDYNDYRATGVTGGTLGYFTGDKSDLPIVTIQDANSKTQDPSFSNAGGTIADSYIPFSTLITGVDLFTGNTVTTDYYGLSRSTTPTMGALDFATWNGSAWNTAPTADYNAKINGTYSGAGFVSRNLVVNAGKQLEVTSGTLAVGNNLTILSDASGTGTLTYSGISVGGLTTVQQYLPHLRNWYVSSPVSGAVAPAGYTYYQRDEAGASWTSQPFNPGDTFTHGKGYIALPDVAASTISFSGTLNSGEISIPLTWSGASSKGFNLIGNPYPSHLSWTEAFVEATSAPEGGVAPATLIEPSIYVRTNAGTVNGSGQWSFLTYNASTGLAVPNNSLLNGGIIPPMQAFWVKAKQAGNLILTSALTKSHQTGNPLKAPSVKNTDRQLIRIEVSNGTKTDETLLFFDDNAQNGYDSYDSPKFAEATSEMQIFTTVGDEKLVMNGLKTMPLNQKIALGFVPGSATSFSMKVNQITNLPLDVRVILIDNASNGLETDLTDGTSSYQFSTSESTSTDRFSLLFRAPGVTTGIETTPKLNARVFVNTENQLTIIAPEKCTYAIYNALGQMLNNGTTTENKTVIDLKSGAGGAGFYVVNVSDAEKVVSTKVIVQ